MRKSRPALRRVYRGAKRVIAGPGRVIHALRHSALHTRQDRGEIFNLDLHVAIIADARAAIENRGLSLTDWSLTAAPWVFGRRRTPVAVLNEHTWRQFNPKMVERFQRVYGPYLRGFKGFIATYPPCFSLLYRGLPGPTLAICATRYEYPLTHDANRWRWFDHALQEGVATGSLTLAANNRADADYVANYTGIRSAYIPSACSYTGTTYTGKRDVTLIATWTDELGREVANQLKQTALPLRQVLGPRYSWADLYDCRALVLVPYNISLMTLFEAYTACIPIYVPDRSFLKQLTAKYPQGVLCHLSFAQVTGKPAAAPPKGAMDLNDVNDPTVLDWYLDRADFYSREWMPQVRQFESWLHLDHLLATDDHRAISDRMAAEKPARLARISALWDSLEWVSQILEPSQKSEVMR